MINDFWIIPGKSQKVYHSFNNNQKTFIQIKLYFCGLLFFVYLLGTNAKTHCKKLENVLQRQSCLSNNDVNKTNDKETSKRTTGSDMTSISTISPSTPADPLVVLFSEKGRCHFCRLLCPDIQVQWEYASYEFYAN